MTLRADRKAPQPAIPGRRLPSAGAKGGRIVRKLAQGTLFAAGIAAAHVSPPENEPRYQIFDPTLVDRLRVPVTRHHE
jgi:hypothetical protein